MLDPVVYALMAAAVVFWPLFVVWLVASSRQPDDK